MQQIVQEYTSAQKDLGIIVNSAFKWCSHVEEISSKGNKMLGFL